MYSAEHSSWQCEGEPDLDPKSLVTIKNEHWPGKSASSQVRQGG